MAREDKRITGNQVIIEVVKYRVWEIDEDTSRTALKEAGFDLSDSFKMWGKEHSKMIMVILASKLNSMEKQLRKPYLLSIKCNSDALFDKTLINEFGQMIAIMVSVLAVVFSITEKINVDFPGIIFALFILAIAYWGLLIVK